MKQSLLFLILIYATAAFAQKAVDTVVIYDGQMSKERIEFNVKGEKVKETIFYKNGKVEYEHFFNDGKDIKWINYDSNGVMNADWTNPEIERGRYSKERNIILILTGVFLLLLVGIGWKLIGYKRTYFLLAFLTVLYPIFCLLFNIPGNNTNEILGLLLASIALELPPILLIVSVRNFIKNSGVPHLVSIISIIISLCLIFLFIRNMILAEIAPGIIG